MASASPSNLWVLVGLGIAGIILMTRRLRRVVKADFGAFVERLELLPPPQPAPPKAPHPLTGLTFAVADVFDIVGYVTGFGHPDWAKTHEAAARTSPVIEALVDGGATCVGRTVIDEFAYGTSGENKHLDTPTNPAAPDRIPGGCSSGSSVAVATGMVDFSLGIDAIGGVRIPAGYCGTLAFRPSQAAVSNLGVIPVSPSLDTIGLFAKDHNIMRRVCHVLLQLPYADSRQPRNIFIADDFFQLLKMPASRVTQVVIKSVEKQYGRQLMKHINLGDYLASKVPSLKQLQNGKKKDDSLTTFLSLANAMRSIHRHEFRRTHEEWIRLNKSVLSSFMTAEINLSDDSRMPIDYCQSARNEARIALNALLKDDGILVLPTVLGSPPKLSVKELSSEDYLIRTLCLTSIASMSGCCQITVPIGVYEKYPVSVSFVARPGGDRFLLDASHSLYVTLQEQAEVVSKSNFSSSSISKEESAEIAKEKGNMAYKERQWQKAISLYTEAIKLNGKNATYHSNRAAAYLELGSYLQAEADCSTAINLDAKNVKAYLRRGTSREMLGYYKEAIEDFKFALVLEPTNKTANLALNRLRKQTLF